MHVPSHILQLLAVLLAVTPYAVATDIHVVRLIPYLLSRALFGMIAVHYSIVHADLQL